MVYRCVVFYLGRASRKSRLGIEVGDSSSFKYLRHQGMRCRRHPISGSISEILVLSSTGI